MLLKNRTPESRMRNLKIGVVISFLLITAPSTDPAYGIMAVMIAAFFRDQIQWKGRYFDWFGVLEILYCCSLVYLAGFSYSPKKATTILVLLALSILAIPCCLIVLFLLFSRTLYIPSLITIALFCFFAGRLFYIYRSKLKTGNTSS